MSICTVRSNGHDLWEEVKDSFFSTVEGTTLSPLVPNFKLVKEKAPLYSVSDKVTLDEEVNSVSYARLTQELIDKLVRTG